MRRSFVLVATFLLCIAASPESTRRAHSSTKTSTEEEIRAALCEIEKSDYPTAQARIEKALQSDPKNIYAQRLLPGLMDAQIKPRDKSPENIAQLRKTVEAYQRAINNPQVSASEKELVDKYLLSLYRRISEEEYDKEFLKRLSDSGRTLEYRSELYTLLASQSWNCAYEITSKPASPGKAELEKAQECVRKGLDYANRAITLDANNEAGWSYKANILLEASKLAGIENNQPQRVSYQNQSDEVLKRSKEVSARREKDQEEKWKKGKPISNTGDAAEHLSKELVEYKAENSLAEAVKEMFIPSPPIDPAELIAPVPIPIPQEVDAETRTRAITREPQKGCFREVDGRAQVEEKRAWKSFSPPDQDITVDLPDNVCASAGGYIAASEGVMYNLISQPHALSEIGSDLDQGVLNSLAWAFVDLRSKIWLRNGPANSFEARLLRRETVSGQPGRVYSLAMNSCSESTDGVLAVYVGKTRYYTLFIEGANEPDQRVERFLKSVKFK
jgi:hypothetical protein